MNAPKRIADGLMSDMLVIFYMSARENHMFLFTLMTTFFREPLRTAACT